MLSPRLHYVYDPLCGWCYAAAPMVEAAIAAGLVLGLHGGGLWSRPVKLAPEQTAHIRDNDDRIARVAGQRFGEGYTRNLLEDPDAVFWSQPAIAGVLAAETLRDGGDVQMLEAVQTAHYVQGRRVVDAEVLADVAAGIGLDRQRFRLAFDMDRAAQHTERSRAFMNRLDLRGFPGFVLETEAGLTRTPHESFYGRPAAFAEAVVSAARQPAA